MSRDKSLRMSVHVLHFGPLDAAFAHLTRVASYADEPVLKDKV